MQKVINKIDIHPLEEAVLGAIWIQWRSLGAFIDTEHPSRTMVDPEALLLVSLTLRHRERRLWDVLSSWAKNGSKLLSLQRVKNLIDRYPIITKERMAEFARLAWTMGNDFRWRSLAGALTGPATRNQKLWKSYPSVWNPSALLLRLRLGFGTSVAPDLLCFLISQRGEWVSTSQVAQAIWYSPYSIRRVADDMALAQLIESTRSKPVKYRVKVDAWASLLEIEEELPIWCFWYQVYAFAAKLIISHETGKWEDLSPYMLSTKLRDLVEDYRDVIVSNHIDLPDPKKFPGVEYLPAFVDTINNLALWIKKEA